MKFGGTMRFKRLPKIVEAEIQSANDFLLENPRATIDGGRRSDPRAGFKITDGDGAVSWVEKSQFEKDFVEAGDD